MFTKGDKVIWDSGFDYEVVTFIGESNCGEDYSIKCTIVNGVEAIGSVAKYEVLQYNEQNLNKVKEKYR